MICSWPYYFSGSRLSERAFASPGSHRRAFQGAAGKRAPASPAFLALALGFAIAAVPVFLEAGRAIASDVYYGRVERVIDGDTISLLTNDYERLRVRLYGIDTPEKGQSWGKAATSALSGLIAGREVRVVVEDVDRYGRQVGLIYLDGQNVNHWMVAQGHAWVYDRYCVLRSVCKAFMEAQEDASEAGAGLWGDPRAVPPWEYRRGRR
jgi:endonuclease YncB( thermonuclease family)